MAMTLSASASSSGTSSATPLMVDGAARPAAAAETETELNDTNNSANDASDDTDPPLSPPWQFRWKRPRWDSVELGIDVNDDEDAINDHNDNEEDVGTASDPPSDTIDESWTPISNSSVVLTRREAQTVIRELHRRNKLILLRPSKSGGGNRRRGRKSTNNNYISSESTQKAGQKVVVPPSHHHPPPSSSPFVSWWKFITSVGKNNENINGKNNANIYRRPDLDIGSKSNKMITNSYSSIHEGKPPIISITSPTSATTTNRYNNDSDDADSNNLSPPSSPTSFSTFSHQPTPKKNNNKRPNETCIDNNDHPNEKKGEDWSGNNDDDDDLVSGGGSSPQIVSDASMASSLLWGEDMTLTTVSEGEAAAYRFHQQAAAAAGGGGGVATTSQSLGSGRGGDDTTYGKGSAGGGGERYGVTDKSSFPSTGRRSHRREQPSGGVLWNEEWNGYDHVVLSVTIFSTTSLSCSPRRMDVDIENERKWSGEVVVMELLSTKNPPLSGSIIPPPPPPPSSSQLPPRGRGKFPTSVANSDGVDSANMENRDQRDINDGIGDDDDDENTTGNHTRILTRRVLWWPTSILSGSTGDTKNSTSRRRSDDYDTYGRETGEEYPSFVSLGRTSIWKHMDQHQMPPSNNMDNDEEQNNRYVNHEYDNMVHKKQGYLPSDDDEDEDKNERAADAMEAVRSMNFLLGVRGLETNPPIVEAQKPPSYSPNQVATSSAMTEEKSTTTTKKKKVTRPLSMCVVTCDGHVHFFYALRVLLSGTSNTRNTAANAGESKNNMDLSHSFEALMFGSKLFAKVNTNVLPLSHPHASVKLSLIECSTSVRGDDNHDQGSDCRDMKSSDPFSRRVDHNADVEIGINEDNQNAHWSSLGLFDASIDPASIHVRTLRRSNTLTGSCMTSDTNNAYLAICGKGVRRIVHRGDNGNQQSASRRQVLGGFVTFVSLRHYTESRTIYLPFAPTSIQPVYWSGMHFVALLGEKNSLKAPRRRRPFVMLVRVDCSPGGTWSNTESE